MIVAVHRVADSNPPTDTGIFCDSAHIRPVVAIPETPTTGATQKNLLKFRMVYKGGPSTHCHEGGIGNMFRSESFPS